MTDVTDGLTTAQRRAVTHAGSPLVVLGGAGTGKTSTLVARFGWLVAQGVAPGSILVLTPSPAGAAALRCRLEQTLHAAYDELAVHTPQDLCARVLSDEAVEAGMDPFAAPVTPADRLAILLDRVDELTLRRHDLSGDPARLLTRVIAHIDRLKAQLVSAADYASWVSTLPLTDDAQRARAAREGELVQLYLDHDRLLARQGAVDGGDLTARVIALLRDNAQVRDRVVRRYAHVLVDRLQDLDLASARVLGLLTAEHRGLSATADDDQAIGCFRAAATRNVDDVLRAHPDSALVRLELSHRCPERVLHAAGAVVSPIAGRRRRTIQGPPGGDVRFWRAQGERAQAQSAAAEAERLVRAGTAPEAIAVLVGSVRDEARAVALALEERGVPFQVVGAADFLAQAEVRDVLAWLRLLADPGDAGAVVRALARPPIGLASVDLARCVQIARRRKLDMVGALAAATESPQLPPEARERILEFLKLHRAAAAALDTTRPDLFVHRLIERLGLRRQQLFAAQADVVERLVGLARLGEMAGAYAARMPHATPREFARYAAAVADAGLRDDEIAPTPAARRDAVAVMGLSSARGLEFDHVFVLGLTAGRMPGARPSGRASDVEPIPDELLDDALPPDDRRAHDDEMRRLLHVGVTRARVGVVLAYPVRSADGAGQPPSPFAEEARIAVDGRWEERSEQLYGPEETLHATFQALRDELLADVGRVGKGLSELRLDTDLDVSHAVVRYLEIVKLAALLERPAGQPVADALAAINQRLGVAVSPVQREILATSQLDALLLDAERDDRARAATRAARREPGLEAFLPRRGEGLTLSASDIETYRTCPLKYKFARVFRIPQEPTLNQRFGILVHHVLERYHQLWHGGAGTLDELLGLLDGGWRRGGFDSSDEERQLRAKAEAALRRYHRRVNAEPVAPVWFERAFSFRLGAHTLRGRVDRVDRLPGGGYELIDYKTGRPRPAAQLKEDVQLSLYAVGAREAWQLDATEQAYLYVLDDEKVRVPHEEIDPHWISDTVDEVAGGILAQGFEPTPSYAACSFCDYRIACPVAER